MKSKPLLLLPSAGYGRRMGSPLSKEMLPDPLGQPLIRFWLDLALELGLPVHVVTRPEKINLIEYVYSLGKRQKVSVQTIDPTRDMSETVLASEPFWQAENIVGLPDTRFAPRVAVAAMGEALSQAPGVYATIDSSEAASFGGVSFESTRTGICEKCAPDSVTKIWGLLGFQKPSGRVLLQAHLQSLLGREPVFFNLPCAEVKLEGFVDLTRPSSPGPSTL